MQLNIYVPKQKAHLLERLKVESQRTGRPKNAFVLEALQKYLAARQPRLGSFHPGEMRLGPRGGLYRRRLSR